jgi:hypothetical protein
MALEEFDPADSRTDERPEEALIIGQVFPAIPRRRRSRRGCTALASGWRASLIPSDPTLPDRRAPEGPLAPMAGGLVGLIVVGAHAFDGRAEGRESRPSRPLVRSPRHPNADQGRPRPDTRA